MKVYFIGAGPGAPDLITVRGANLLRRCPVVIYAGSLVSRGILRFADPRACLHDSSRLTLDALEALFIQARDAGRDVARLHSGDPTIYGALAEQMGRLSRHRIPYEVVPGVSSFTASAAVVPVELTRPGISQTVILTRHGGRSSRVPDLEGIRRLASHRATMAIFLSGNLLRDVLKELREVYPPQTPLIAVYKATWRQEEVVRGTLAEIPDRLTEKRFRLSTMLLVGDALEDGPDRDALGSCLYDSTYTHLFRKGVTRR